MEVVIEYDGWRKIVNIPCESYFRGVVRFPISELPMRPCNPKDVRGRIPNRKDFITTADFYYEGSMVNELRLFVCKWVS